MAIKNRNVLAVPRAVGTVSYQRIDQVTIRDSGVCVAKIRCFDSDDVELKPIKLRFILPDGNWNAAMTQIVVALRNRGLIDNGTLASKPQNGQGHAIGG